jgi:hypothetical protein
VVPVFDVSSEICFACCSNIDSQPALSFTSGTLEASGLYFYALQKADELNRAIARHLGIVDDLLAELINPTSMSVTVDDLARDHGYPVGDLFEIDMEWF